MALGSFLITFVLTNLAFSLAVLPGLLTLGRNMNPSRVEIFLYSLGIGPVLTSLLLYYLFLLLPHQPAFFYFCTVLFFYTCFFILGIKYYRVPNKEEKAGNGWQRERKNSWKGIFCFYNLTIGLVFVFLITLCIFNVFLIPLNGNDILEYANLGNILFAEKSLASIFSFNYSGRNGFVNLSYHAPSFPLLQTWQNTINEFFKIKYDFYFRSLSPYYGLLILMIQSYWFSKISRGVALLGLLSFLSSSYFFASLFYAHLDTYRIYFLVVMWIWMGYSIRTNSRFPIVMFGLFAGFAAFAHSIGVFIVAISYILLIVFTKDLWDKKIVNALLAMGLILICGGVYYLIDAFWGKGWIFGKALLSM